MPLKIREYFKENTGIVRELLIKLILKQKINILNENTI